MPKKNATYYRYKRGQIVMVNFDPSVGSEIRGKHFAIILTKKDSTKNAVLTVIPLSSKKKSYYIDIGNIIGKQITPTIVNLLHVYEIILNNIDSKSEQVVVSKFINNCKELIKVAEIYETKNKRSYAMVQNITTISKKRILKPLNSHDPLKNLTANNLILDMIDKKIIELFTNNK